MRGIAWALGNTTDGSCRKVTEDCIIAVQIFDQKKFTKRNQGFLGVVNLRVRDIIDLRVGGDGKTEPNLSSGYGCTNLE